MSTLATALAWCCVQVTLLTILSGGLYLALRRWRPTAAAAVLLAGLAMVVVLSLGLLSPWPRWTNAMAMVKSYCESRATAGLPSSANHSSSKGTAEQAGSGTLAEETRPGAGDAPADQMAWTVSTPEVGTPATPGATQRR